MHAQWESKETTRQGHTRATPAPGQLPPCVGLQRPGKPEPPRYRHWAASTNHHKGATAIPALAFPVGFSEIAAIWVLK